MAFTRELKAHITPTMKRQIKELAVEDGVSVSTYFRNILIAHAKKKGWTEPSVRHGGYLYLIECLGFHKIGIAADVRSRLSGMSLPRRPKIIASVLRDDYKSVEKKLHAMFAHKKTHGEWFDLNANDVLAIKEVFRGG